MLLLEAPHQVPTTYLYVEKLRKLSQNYQQILLTASPAEPGYTLP